MLKIESIQVIKVEWLWHHNLQFLPMRLYQLRTRLGAHANPVNARWSGNRAVGFHRNLETFGV